MKRIGVVLSGCGVKDGSEIHEAVAALLAIDRHGAQAVCMAPNQDFEITNHLTQKPTGEKRNALLESARIARGDIQDIATMHGSEIDALIFPGGYGAVKNLSNFASKGLEAIVLPEVSRLVNEMISAHKPIGAICISPATIAAIIGQKVHPQLTIGNDSETTALLEKLGVHHQTCTVKELTIDEKNKIVSTPAYMLATRVSEVFDGIDRLVKEVLRMA